MSTCCQTDERRNAVRRLPGYNGLDYLEVSDDQRTLTVYFLGKLPPELAVDKPDLQSLFAISGGERIQQIKVLDATPEVDEDPEKDDRLLLTLSTAGDYSTYTLTLSGVNNLDPRYAALDFSFKVNCPSALDCTSASACEPPRLPTADLNYLAKDYQSFRALLLDRMALNVPDWRERHVPDLGIALVETLAYTGDYLSYYQDSVATEAYLDTARQRISLRRHARLVDYRLHEGCNARAWLAIATDTELTLDASEASFITGLNAALAPQQTVLNWEDLRAVPTADYEVFEPYDKTAPIVLRPAHSELRFYSFGQRDCCLPAGSTQAALLDGWAQAGPPMPPPEVDPTPTPSPDSSISKAASVAGRPATRPSRRQRLLQYLAAGDVLIFEEVIGPKTGLAADADPARRHALRLTRVTPREDPVLRDPRGGPALYVEIEWAAADALPLPFCLSAIGPAPACAALGNISVARGNVVLIDHGKTHPNQDLGCVAGQPSDVACDCVGEPGEVRVLAKKFRPTLSGVPLTWRAALPTANAGGSPAPAAVLLAQDPRSAAPQLQLLSTPQANWQPAPDLLASAPDAADFVVEIDNDARAHLRFGDGECGRQPPAGMVFSATPRLGNGVQGNVGAESISRLVLAKTTLNGPSLTLRNPLPASGGIAPEPLTEARLYAPQAFRQFRERAIVAADYAELAARNTALQGASAALQWSGSWNEAVVAVDPLGSETASPALLKQVACGLYRYRRIGHDLRVLPARYVPLDLVLEVCVLSQVQRAHVLAALLERFSTRRLPGGALGFFHPDAIGFGADIYLSQIIAAAQAVPGVECVSVSRLQRLFSAANQELENGLLALAVDELAQLDNDPNHPEHGRLAIVLKGGR